MTIPHKKQQVAFPVKLPRHQKTKLTVEFDVTEAQALSLMAMFRYCNQLAGVGSSRYVAFYADGDGDFRPKCKWSTPENIELTDEIYKYSFLKIHEDPQKNKAELKLSYGDAMFDFDKIAWRLDDK